MKTTIVYVGAAVAEIAGSSQLWQQGRLVDPSYLTGGAWIDRDALAAARPAARFLKTRLNPR